ncbi:hypothetical protein [Campylobacter concisus]|uniref:hypothetical protein n=1 Tax=Campylobacter concisus TaxID=199 RepID=UPI0015E17A69|nr:hypothetical protein [Campylobacter concisus]
MTKRASISIEEALQNSNVKTYEMQDKKDKKTKEKYCSSKYLSYSRRNSVFG